MIRSMERMVQGLSGIGSGCSNGFTSTGSSFSMDEGQPDPPLLQPDDPPPPLTVLQAMEAFRDLQQQFTQFQAEQREAAAHRSYASAAAVHDLFSESTRKLEGIAKIVGRLSEEGDSVSSWLSSVEDAFGIYHISSDSDRVMTAALLLRGPFQQYWAGRRRQILAELQTGVREEPVSWQEFGDELRRRWPEHGTPFHDTRRALFDLRLQGTGVPDFTQRFTQLLAEADPAVDPLSATEVYLRALPDTIRTEVERVRPTQGWVPATALSTVQQELQRLYDANIVHNLLRAPAGNSGTAGSTGSQRSNKRTRNTNQAGAGTSASHAAAADKQADAARVARCMAERLCFHCMKPLSTCGHTAKDCPQHPKHSKGAGPSKKA